MVKNFIKTAFRNLAKNKLISFINIFGLSMALSVGLVVYIFMDFAYGQDEFHENKESIFLLHNVVARDGAEEVWGDSPAPIGEMLKTDLPQVKDVARVESRRVVVKYEDKVFNEYVRFVDPSFLEMFTFPTTLGRKEALQDPSQVVISQLMAEKYFGERNPVGEQIVIIANDKKESFTIGGVAAPFPKNASFRFDMLLSFDKKITIYDDEDPNDWTKFIDATFVQLNDPQDIDLIRSQMDKYIALQNAADENWPAKAYVFEPLTTLSQNSYKIRGDISGGNDPAGSIVLITIGTFMMLLASFNYINISISSATKRLKEIGIRKVVGGTRRQLALQFIGENLITCFFALLLGGIWARTIIAPWFDSQFSIGLELNFYQEPEAWGFLIVLLLITGIGSGAYPALYISSFRPVNILRGRQKFGKKNTFTRLLLTFQFVLSMITIVFGVAFLQNGQYQQDRDWGYDQAQTLVVPVDNGKTYAALKNELLQRPGVLELAGSVNHIGRSVRLAVIDIDGQKHEIRQLDVGYDYLETLDVRLQKGRFFDEALVTDLEESAVVNQTFADNMGWEDPIGQSFGLDSLTYTVVGVVADFHYYNFNNEIEPAFFRMAKEDKFRYLSLKVGEGTISRTEAYVKELWKKYVPDKPYAAFFQDEVFDEYFHQLEGHGKVMSFTAILATILSCMGLFGLVSLNVAARMKEFSIRKVLGAGLAAIFNGINRQYLLLLVIASILGLPVSYWLLGLFFKEVYTYHMPLTMIPLLVSAVCLFGVALITVSSQIYKVMASNPVEALRNE